MVLLKRIFVAILLFIGISIFLIGQEKEAQVLNMDMKQAIALAQSQSIRSLINKNNFLSAYWANKSYKGSKLPGIDLDVNPLSYSNNYFFDESNEEFKYRQSLNSTGEISISQNLVLTGGVLGIGSNLTRYQSFEKRGWESFQTNPINMFLRQPLNGYNTFRWDSKIEPLKFEIAKREFIQSLEDISVTAIRYFFNQVSDEINLKIAQTNYSNADTLYRIAKGRFEIGTVTQDEMLDLELGLLNSKINIVKAELNLKQSQILLNSFLGLDETVVVNCIIPDEIPNFDIELDKVLNLALENNPEILEFERQLLSAQRNVVSTKAGSGLKAQLNASYGISNSADNIADAYKPEFMKGESFGLSFTMPILDWGERKGQIQMSKAGLAVVEAQVRQARIDFNQNVFQQVAEFNMQDDQVEIAAKADTVSALGYDVTKQRFLIGKVDVIKLNAARNSVDAAKRNYVDALWRYWDYFYAIRQLTLYDFERNQSLMKELDYLLEK
ncbi:MAG: TolC family protein [Marinilabiliaceae bacterium]|nr:TolC family protein [Marinilabiliaceae bacterium]